MITEQKLKADLADVRYYYTRKSALQEAYSVLAVEDVGSDTKLQSMTERYNRIMYGAPARLVDIYKYVYIDGGTIEGFSIEAHVCGETAKRWHRQLIMYLLEKINGQVA